MIEVLGWVVIFWVGLALASALGPPRLPWPTGYRPRKGPKNPIPPGYRRRKGEAKP
jgi:hypothetical protein